MPRHRRYYRALRTGATRSVPTTPPPQDKPWVATSIGLYIALVLVALIGSRICDSQRTHHQGHDPADVGAAAVGDPDDVERLVGLHLSQAPREY
jgi:hypothetical protein